MKTKTKLKRKNLIGLVSLAILSLIIYSNIVVAADAKLTGMTYDEYFTPTDNLDIKLTIEWTMGYQHIVGDIIVYYNINVFTFKIDNTYTLSFTPDDDKAETHYLTVNIPNLRDGDKIKFKVYLYWKGYVNEGELWSDLGKSTFVESGTIPDSGGWAEYKVYVYIGLGVFAGLIALSILTRRRKR